MSRKEMMIAAALFAAGQKSCAEDESLFDNSSHEQDVAYLISMNKYVPAAVAMVEAAFNVIFKYPEDYHQEVYYHVGYRFAEQTSWNGRTDEFDPPDDEFVHSELVMAINSDFHTGATMEQRKAIDRVIKQAWLDNKPA